VGRASAAQGSRSSHQVPPPAPRQLPTSRNAYRAPTRPRPRPAPGPRPRAYALPLAPDANLPSTARPTRAKIRTDGARARHENEPRTHAGRAKSGSGLLTKW
jgi:hypothetical protein